MAAVALESIIGYVNLLGLIEEIKTGIPQPLPDSLLSKSRDTLADAGEYTVVKGARTLARLAQYGSAARLRQLKGVDVLPIKLLHTVEAIKLNPLLLAQLRAYDSYTLNRGKEEIARQVKEFVVNFTNLRIAAVQGLLANGQYWFDADGNFLPSSSGSVENVTFGVPANNQNQLNGIIATGWQNSNADIPTQLAQLQEVALQTSGYRIEAAFYGRNVASYIAKNDFALEYMARNSEMNAEYLEGNGKKLGGSIPQGLFGIKHWVPVNEGFFEDSAGTNQAIWNADAVTFTPSVEKPVLNEWYDLIEGSYEVPTTVNLQETAAQTLDSFKHVQGMFAYSIPKVDPSGIYMIHGDTFIPVLKVAGAIFQAIVKV